MQIIQISYFVRTNHTNKHCSLAKSTWSNNKLAGATSATKDLSADAAKPDDSDQIQKQKTK